MAQIKVGYRFNPSPYPFIKNGRMKRGNFCRECGKPLKDAESITRGYGPECWKSIPVILVLDIQAVEQGLHQTEGSLPDLQAESTPEVLASSQASAKPALPLVKQ